MLKQRVITALILVAILLPTLVADAAWPFALLTLVFISAAGWEWSRLNEAPGLRAVLLGAAVAGARGYMALRFGPTHWRAIPEWLRRLLGLVLLVVAWMALVESKAQGLNHILSVFCLVWAADIGAYFGGRAFGRRKVACWTASMPCCRCCRCPSPC